MVPPLGTSHILTEVNEMTRDELISQWRAVVDKQVASGLSAAVFCREQDINAQRFYQWRRRFYEQAINRMPSGFVELIPCSEHPHSGIRIRVQDRVCIEVERGFDPFTLRAVIETINGGENKSCSP